MIFAKLISSALTSKDNFGILTVAYPFGELEKSTCASFNSLIEALKTFGDVAFFVSLVDIYNKLSSVAVYSIVVKVSLVANCLMRLVPSTETI